MKPEKFNNEKFVEIVEVRIFNLVEELAKNPSWLAYYGAQATAWESIEDLKKVERDTRGSQITVELKDSGSKATDAYINARKQIDEEFLKLARELRVAREQVGLYKNAVNALEKKQFSLGAINNRSMVEENYSGHSSVQFTGDLRSKKQGILDKLG